MEKLNKSTRTLPISIKTATLKNPLPKSATRRPNIPTPPSQVESGKYKASFQQPNSQPPSPQKPRSMFRRITTKLRTSPTNPSAPPSPKLPSHPSSHVNSIVGKGNREAALRERGLLPPVRPDLSTLEKKQDKRLEITPVPAEEQEKHEGQEEMTAAKRIKEEWEAKNLLGCVTDSQALAASYLDHHKQRLSDFKFGGDSPTASSFEDLVNTAADYLAAELLKANSVTTDDAATAVDDQSIQDMSPTPKARPAVEVIRGQFPFPRGRKRSSSLSELHVHNEDAASSLAYASSIPLPPSPPPKERDCDLPDQDNSFTISLTLSPPLSLTWPESSSPKATTTPAAEDVPPALPPRDRRELAIIVSKAKSTPDPASSPACLPSPEVRARTLESPIPVSPSMIESASVPSLTVSAESSHSTPLTDSPLSDKFPRSGLKIHTQGHGFSNIPMIMESPVEESEIRPPDSGMVMSDGKIESRTKINSSRGLKPPSAYRLSTVPDLNQPPATVERRKTLALFASSSIGSLRRSVVGTLSRPKLSAAVKPVSQALDVTDLPSSPTSRSQYSSSSDRYSVKSSEALSGRKAVEPTMHNMGTIMHVASKIKDDESRRLSELAFLG